MLYFPNISLTSLVLSKSASNLDLWGHHIWKYVWRRKPILLYSNGLKFTEPDLLFYKNV